MARFELPDVGEGLTEAEIVSWKVQPGDEVAVNDVIVEIETAKSLVELPSPFAGTVTALLADEGQAVMVGSPIIDVEVVGDGSASAAAEGAVGEGGDKSEPVLVGYGPRPSRRRRRASRPKAAEAVHDAFSRGQGGPELAEPAPAGSVEVDGPAPAALPLVGEFPDEAMTDEGPGSGAATREAGGRTSGPDAGAGSDAAARASTGRPLAKPPVRRLARDLGVDLAEVQPSGPSGTVTRADVEAHSQRLREPAPITPQPLGWDGLPREERVAVRSVRRATARAVVASAFTAPHVTQFVTIDVTASMHLLDRLRADDRFAGVRLSPLTLTARAAALSVRRTPEVNAQWDADAGEIVLRRYVDLAVATATPRGLIVPVVRDADRLDLATLATSIADLASRAREGRTTPQETSGGTISVTNIGVFGMDGGTPIMPPGQSAILALGQVARRPWVVSVDGEERVEPRWVTTLALSFDHRLVDGAQGAAYLRDVASSLSDPAKAWAVG